METYHSDVIGYFIWDLQILNDNVARLKKEININSQADMQAARGNGEQKTE